MSNETLSVPRTSDDLLRRILRIDGWATGAFGVFMLAGAVPLRDPLGIPVTLSIPFGIVMLAGAAALLLIARNPVISVRHVTLVVVANSASVLGMIALAGSGLLDLTVAGIAFMLAGAVVVAAFVALEYAGLRRIRGRAA